MQDWPNWRHRTVVIVASGPSLSDQQCQLVQERREADACRVIVVNDNYQRVPNADVLFAADYPWWKLHNARVSEKCPKIARWSCEPMTRPWGTTVWPAEAGTGIAPDSEYRYRRGSSSGFMSIGLAIKWGARHIVMVGIDCKKSREGKNHWFGDHPAKLLPSQQPFMTWAAEFDGLAKPAAERGIRIVNCTIDTAVKLLPRSTLEAELYAAEDLDQDLGPHQRVDEGQRDEDSRRAA